MMMLNASFQWAFTTKLPYAHSSEKMNLGRHIISTTRFVVDQIIRDESICDAASRVDEAMIGKLKSIVLQTSS
ncbi:hypothetical protein TNCV_192851 [Trichonephila clavipes]|nr:hypothetical protein TNCV_192851 [Trichonephila clavipes]